MTSFNFLKSGTFYSSVVLVLSAVFTSLAAQYPGVVWLGTIVSLLSFVSVNYFHRAAVIAASQPKA